MEKITSVQNQWVKQALGLREASNRRKEGLIIIDGERAIKRGLEAGLALEKIFYLSGKQTDLLKTLNAKKIQTIEVADKVMEKLSYGDKQDEIIALAKTPQRTLKDLKLSASPLVVVLESLEKPGNLGAILRTCDAVGIEAVLVCDPKTDIYNPNVIRSSTGVVFSLPVVADNADSISAFLKSRKIKTCALAPAGAKLYTQVNYKGALAFVLGREDQGLSDFWLEAADMTVKIPMQGMADSLNVSTSAAVILYEALRQRQA